MNLLNRIPIKSVRSRPQFLLVSKRLWNLSNRKYWYEVHPLVLQHWKFLNYLNHLFTRLLYIKQFIEEVAHVRINFNNLHSKHKLCKLLWNYIKALDYTNVGCRPVHKDKLNWAHFGIQLLCQHLNCILLLCNVRYALNYLDFLLVVQSKSNHPY